MNEKNIPYSVQVRNFHVDDTPEYFQKYPYNPTKRELRKAKRKNKQIGTQIRRSKEKQELQTLNEQEENLS